MFPKMDYDYVRVLAKCLLKEMYERQKDNFDIQI